MTNNSRSADNDLKAHWHMLPLCADDERSVRAAKAIEQVLPWAVLRFQISEEGVPVPLRDRDRWLLNAAAVGDFPLIANDDESRAITIYGSLMKATEYAPAGCNVSARFPEEPEVLRRAAELVAAVGVALGAWWGCASQEDTKIRMIDLTDFGGPGAEGPPTVLPRLARRRGEVPHHLGWINYWSRATCARIGFPDPARHAELLKRARRVEGGGWVVQLTEESLDLDIPSHLEALARAYDLLPVIGGRDTTH